MALQEAVEFGVLAADADDPGEDEPDAAFLSARSTIFRISAGTPPSAAPTIGNSGAYSWWSSAAQPVAIAPPE